MKPSAVLLIDLENFVLSRFDHFNRENIRVEDRPSFAEDLKNLVGYARRTAGLPFAVRRAYADFDTLNVNPQELMRLGVEPVQVFRLSGPSANKNAADMKLAMDAVSIAGSGPQFEHFVLISGDADFIPVILELKRRGHTVSVIAVTGATNELIQHFADHFHLFEELVPAEAPKTRVRVSGPDDLPRIGAALRRLLARARPMRLNLVQPQLSKELGYTFEASAFGCESTGEFLRKNAPALGVVVRGTQNEQELDLPPVPVPSSNGTGTHGPKAPARAASVAVQEPHVPSQYKQLLASGRTDANEARVLVVPWSSLVWVCDAVVPALTPPTGAPATSMELMPRLQEAARATGSRDLAGHVALIHSALRCALPVPSPEGIYALGPGTTGADIRHRLLRYVVYVLNTRMGENGVTGAIRAETLAAVFDPGAEVEQATTEVATALAEGTSAPAPQTPTPVTPRPAPRADEVHTAAGYRKLFQCGGPKGSGETEHTRVNPPPWPSVERVCTDTFTALTPTIAGATELQRGQFLERLYAAENEMCVEGYRSHVRRSFTLLRLSHAVLENDDRVTLHPDVSDPSDIRWAVLGSLLNLLAIRLDEKRVTGPIQADAFVAAIEAGPYTDELVPQIERAVEGMSEVAETGAPVDAPPEPVAGTAVPLELSADHADETVPVVEPISERAPEKAYGANGPTESGSLGWGDPYSFDGALPDDPPAVAEPERASFPTPVETASDAIDVAALTRAAVADSLDPVVRVLPGAASPAPEVVPVEGGATGQLEPTPELETLPFDDEYPLAIPVADWVPDDTFFAEPTLADQLLAGSLSGSGLRSAPPSPEHPETQAPLATITFPPPPLSPLPPESA